MNLITFICKLIGHKEVDVFETRYRSDGTKRKKSKFLHYGIGDVGSHPVKVHYKVCKRCGKKLSNAERVFD